VCVAEDKLLQAQRPARVPAAASCLTVLPDRALYSPTCSHLLIVNNRLYPSHFISLVSHQVLMHVNALERLAVCLSRSLAQRKHVRTTQTHTHARTSHAWVLLAQRRVNKSKRGNRSKEAIMRPTALMEGRCKTGTEAYNVSAPVRTSLASTRADNFDTASCMSRSRH
jgi:hypothetical protein